MKLLLVLTILLLVVLADAAQPSRCDNSLFDFCRKKCKFGKLPVVVCQNGKFCLDFKSLSYRSFVCLVSVTPRLSYVEPSLHPWDEACLVMVDNILMCSWIRFANVLLSIFVSMFMREQKDGPCFCVHSVNLCLFIGFLYLDGYFLIYVGKIYFNDFVEYVFCAFELVFFSFFYPYHSKMLHNLQDVIIVFSTSAGRNANLGSYQ
ncbi:hypothetical protein STEG23_023332 [Scotinomys teguina]